MSWTIGCGRCRAARVALELLAVWEQVGLADLESVAGAGPVEELDLAGLLEVRSIAVVSRCASSIRCMAR